MTGVGAGSIMTPLLLVVGLPPISAVGTDLAHSAVSKALGTSLYWKGKSVNGRFVGWLLVGAVVAVGLGGYLVVAIRSGYGEGTLNYVVSTSIALILIVAGANYLLISRDFTSATPGPDPPPSSASLSSIGFLIGLAVNMTSVGAGSLLMPYLMRKLRSTREMVGTDLAFGFSLTLIAAFLQTELGNVLLVPLLCLLAGSLPGTYLGVRLGKRVHVRHMKAILATLILIAGVSILVKLFA